jgi:saccharopine dehydrogenase-like NADP-dependent oxidoreductase
MSLIGRLESRFGITQIDSLRLRVGALTQLAEPPTYYSFTWSTEGVATEYVERAQAIRGGKTTALPSLTGSETVFLEGLTLEARLTSGGTADLCEALVGKVQSLDYKTLRFPGHYDWVDQQLAALSGDEAPAKELERRMKESVAHDFEDMIVLYAAAEGRGADGVLRRESESQTILPIRMTPTLTLSAIQITTAATLAQSAEFLLERRSRSAGGGVLLQSQLPAEEFLSSRLIRLSYDNDLHPEFKRGLS